MSVWQDNVAAFATVGDEARAEWAWDVACKTFVAQLRGEVPVSTSPRFKLAREAVAAARQFGDGWAWVSVDWTSGGAS